MNMTLYFGKLRKTLAWGYRGWFLLVREPEPMVCKVKWSDISLCQKGLSEVVQPIFRFIKPCFSFRAESSVLAGKQASRQAGTTFILKMD